MDPTIRIRFWGAVSAGTYLNLVQLVADQLSDQRYITAESLCDTWRAL